MNNPALTLVLRSAVRYLKARPALRADPKLLLESCHDWCDLTTDEIVKSTVTDPTTIFDAFAHAGENAVKEVAMVRKQVKVLLNPEDLKD